MDYCPLPREPIRAHIEIPYLCSDLQYTGSFCDYSTDSGWTVAELFYFDFEQSSRIHEDTDPFLQSWFVFGLIEETLALLLARYRVPYLLLLF